MNLTSFWDTVGEDFYEFACGGFIKNKRIPDDASDIGMFQILDDKLTYAIAG